jgi:DNA-binding transcriptional LysR family regulator
VKTKYYYLSVRYTLRQLEYFVAAAETGTLSGAAARCHVSQAGIALAVTDLERALGVQLLLRRKAKGVTLTPAGQRVLADARALLGQAEELQSTAEASGGQLAGRLRMGCYTVLAPFFVPPLLDTFAAEHPLLRLDVVEDAQPELQRLLLDGAIEVALLYDRGLHPDIDHRLVRRLRPYVLLSADHRLARNPQVSLADLADEPLIRLDLPPMTQGSEVSAAGRGASAWYRTPNLELVRCLVGRGLGYAVLVQHPQTEVTYDGRRVTALPIADDVPDVSVVLAHPRGAQLTRRAEALGQFCRAILSAADPIADGAATLLGIDLH